MCWPHATPATIDFAVCPIVATLNKLRSEISKTNTLHGADRVCTGTFYEFEVDALFLPIHLLATG